MEVGRKSMAGRKLVGRESMLGRESHQLKEHLDVVKKREIDTERVWINGGICQPHTQKYNIVDHTRGRLPGIYSQSMNLYANFL